MSDHDFEISLRDALSKLRIFWIKDLNLNEENYLESDFHEKMLFHYVFLLKYKKVLNLTAFEIPVDIAYKLYADSLLPLYFIKMQGDIHILDIGPGGGFPSIPLGIFTGKQVKYTLVEKREKVVFFLEDYIDFVKLDHIQVIHARVEDIAKQSSHQSRYDMILNKATLPIEKCFDRVSPLVKKGGYILHWTKEHSCIKIPNGWEKLSTCPPPLSDDRFPGIVMIYRKTVK